MKNKLIFSLFLALTIATVVLAQTQQETIYKTGSFKNTGINRVLSVENIHGFVHVEAHAGETVALTAEKKITAKDQAGVDKGLREVEVKLIETADSIYVFVDAPFVWRKKTRGRQLIINLEEIGYEYQVDITLKVPANLNLIASTVNNGDLTVTDITGDIKAWHVNGPIVLKGVAGSADATTVNGRVDIFYKQNPIADARFKTINGNININYAPKLNATVAFKSMNGKFFTDLSEVEIMPVQIIKNTEGRGEGTVFKISKMHNYRVGNGGPALYFETLNGNMYLKKH